MVFILILLCVLLYSSTILSNLLIKYIFEIEFIYFQIFLLQGYKKIFQQQQIFPHYGLNKFQHHFFATCSKKSKLNISLDQLSKFGFVVCQVEEYRNILKLSCQLLTFTSYEAFLKNKEVCN